MLADYQYTYSSISNVTSRTDSDGTVTTFGYDASDQLTSESRDNSHSTGYSIAYTYDHNGNRLTKVLNSVTDTYSYTSHDRLSSVSFGGGGSKSYGYDNNGNCTSVTVGTSVTSLTYDYENRVTGITYPSTATNSFSYNGLGLRTGKTDSSGTFAYVCDGDEAASAVLKDGAATYTPGLSERRGTTSKFYHGDALGSTRGITNSSQSVTDSVLYDAFGMTVSRTGTTPIPFGFVGGSQYQTDTDSGLMLLGHRYYDASIGRFISQDPIQDGDNWYAYCENNPLTGTDPSGLKENSRNNQKRRKRIANIAIGYNGDTDWGKDKQKEDFPKGSWKCNLFVIDVLKEAGAAPPKPSRRRRYSWPPRAGDWSNPDLNFPNWRKLNPGESPQPGDIGAYPLPHGDSAFSGHCGIIVVGGDISAHEVVVGTDDPHNPRHQFAPPLEPVNRDKNIVYRRYIGE